MKIKVKVEGRGASIVSAIIARALRDQGIKTVRWTECGPKELSKLAKEADGDEDVMIFALVEK